MTTLDPITFPELPPRASRQLVDERVRGILAAVPNRATGGTYATTDVVVTYDAPDHDETRRRLHVLGSTRVGIDGLAGSGEPVLVGYDTGRGNLLVLPIRWIRVIEVPA